MMKSGVAARIHPLSNECPSFLLPEQTELPFLRLPVEVGDVASLRRTDIGDGIEGIRVIGLHHSDHRSDIFSFHHQKDQLYRTMFSRCIHDGNAEIVGFKCCNQVTCIVLGDDPDEIEPDGHPLLHDDAHIVAEGKPGRVGDDIRHTPDILEDLRNGYEPYEDLEEGNHRGEQFHAP